MLMRSMHSVLTDQLLVPENLSLHWVRRVNRVGLFLAHFNLVGKRENNRVNNCKLWLELLTKQTEVGMRKITGWPEKSDPGRGHH